MDAFLIWLKNLVIWFKTPVKLMIVLAILSAVGLFIPHHFQETMGIAEWTAKNRVPEWIVLIFSTAWITVTCFEMLFEWGMIHRQLQSLPKDQREILRYYVSENVSAHPWYASNSAARALECEGLLVMLPRVKVAPENEHQQDGILFYRIKPRVLRYLKRRPTLVL
jgi:hypothetical protein